MALVTTIVIRGPGGGNPAVLRLRYNENGVPASADRSPPRQKTHARPMTVGREVRQSPNQWEHGLRRPWARGKLRQLFGFQGWPSGVLEIASWAKREGLAEPAIVPLRPDASARDEALQAIRREAAAKHYESRLFLPDGSPSEPIREALGPWLPSAASLCNGSWRWNRTWSASASKAAGLTK